MTLIWPDVETGVPCKAQPDYLPAHRRWIVDLKTAASANPRSWRDQAYRLGYHARAASYLDGAVAALGQMPEEYWFVIVEKEPPYLVSVVSFDEDALAWGRTLNREACERFAVSAAANDWPGYRDPGQNHDPRFPHRIAILGTLPAAGPPRGRRVHARAVPRPRFAGSG